MFFAKKLLFFQNFYPKTYTSAGTFTTVLTPGTYTFIIRGAGGAGGRGGVAKDLDNTRKKANMLSVTLSSLQRIAFYRVIRSAIKAVGQAFSEGAENA